MIFAALLLCILLGTSPSLSGTVGKICDVYALLLSMFGYGSDTLFSIDDPLSHMHRSSVPVHGGGIEV